MIQIPFFALSQKMDELTIKKLKAQESCFASAAMGLGRSGPGGERKGPERRPGGRWRTRGAPPERGLHGAAVLSGVEVPERQLSPFQHVFIEHHAYIQPWGS